MSGTLKARLEADLKTALKAKARVRTGVLRLALDAIRNEEISQKRPVLTDEEALRMLEREAKQRREAVALYLQGGRANLAEAERQELAVLSAYLPAPLRDEELERVVREVVAARGSSSLGAVGPVMKEVMAKVRGRAEGTRVQAVVSRILSA